MPTLKKAAFLAAAIMFIFSPKLGLSQSTATVTDSDSISWVGGTYQITLVPVPPNVTPYRSDTGQNITTSFSGTLDGSGSFSVTLTPISVILPKGLTWQFTVCPNVLAGACGTVNIPVNGSGSVSSQINAVITAPRISGGRGSYAYADVEVAAVANNSYYNVTSAALRCYGAAWAACGGGGGGAVSSVFTRTGAVVATTGDYTVSQVTGAAPLASPTFTGVPAAPTAAVNTNTTQLATTAFVLANQAASGISGLTANCLPKAASATTITGCSSLSDDGTTLTGTEGIAAPSFTASGASSGYAGLTAGSSVTAAPTSTVLITVPTSVTAYGLELPGAQPTSGNTAISCTAANPSVCTWVVPGGAPTGAASNGLTGTYPGPGIALGAISPAQQQFSVTKYGAACNGSTDDSTAIQAAITAAAGAGGGVVIIPASICNFSTKLTRPRTVIIQGQGRTVSLLNYTGTGVGMVLGDTASSAPLTTTFKGGFRDFTLIASTFNSGTTCLYLGGDPAGVISPSNNADDNEAWYRFGVANCGIGAQVGNNTYLLKAIDVIFGSNGQHWVDTGVETNSGEGMTFTSSIFGGSVSSTAPAIELDNNLSDYYFTNDSIDYNNVSQPDIGCVFHSGAQGGIAQIHAHLAGVHMEKFNGEFVHWDNANCIGEVHFVGGSMTFTSGVTTSADMIGIIGSGSYQNVLSVFGTSINSKLTLTQFIDANGGARQITLDSLDFGYNGNTTLPLGINNHGDPAGITIRSTINLASVIGDATQITNGRLLVGPNATTSGAFLAYGTNPFAGVYDTRTSRFFGINPTCAQYSDFYGICGANGTGVGINGLSTNSGGSILSLWNSTQAPGGGSGLGQTSFYVGDGNNVNTFNNVLDDGSGKAIFAGDIKALSIGATTPGTGAFTMLAVGGSQALTNIQGTAGTKLPAASGTFTNGNLRSTNSTGDEVDSGVATSTVARVSSAITSATAGSGISAVTCTTAACTNLRGTYTMTATTVSAGATILTLVWPTTTTAYVCLVSQDGGTLAIAPSHSVATATGMAIVSDLAITSGSIGIDYSCQP